MGKYTSIILGSITVCLADHVRIRGGNLKVKTLMVVYAPQIRLVGDNMSLASDSVWSKISDVYGYSCYAGWWWMNHWCHQMFYWLGRRYTSLKGYYQQILYRGHPGHKECIQFGLMRKTPATTDVVPAFLLSSTATCKNGGFGMTPTMDLESKAPQNCTHPKQSCCWDLVSEWPVLK